MTNTQPHHLHSVDMLSKLSRSKHSLGGPAVTLGLTVKRGAGSLPRQQAQATDMNNTLNTNQAGITPLLTNVRNLPGPPFAGRGIYPNTPVPPEMTNIDHAANVHLASVALPKSRDEFWRKVAIWENVSADDFLSYRWSVSCSLFLLLICHFGHCVTLNRMQVANTVQGTAKLSRFLQAVIPETVPFDKSSSQVQTREEFIKDVLDGVTAATMAIRMT